jgi:hypothetical protein
MRLAKTALLSACGRFCANFLNLSNFLLYVKYLFWSRLYRIEAAQTQCWRAFLDASEPKRQIHRSIRISILRAAQNFQTATSITRAAKARGGFPPGLAMACSLKDSPQGSRGIQPTSPDPTNQLPTSHSGQAQRPPGGSTAHLQLFKNSTRHPCLQLATPFVPAVPLQLFENNNDPALTQAQCLWESQV